jgi:predicted lipoprotein
VITVFLIAPSAAGAQELTLLSIESDLIGEVTGIDADATATEVINTYYAQLPEKRQAALHAYTGQLKQLMVDYGIARTAADSAELTEVMFDMNVAWIEIQRIHRGAFTSAVTQQLDEAYSELYPVL